jgi:enoyl-CoA hydratase/carnithine racemase
MGAKQGSDLHLYMFEMLGKTIETKDAQEGLKAFMEKRQPVWTGE